MRYVHTGTHWVAGWKLGPHHHTWDITRVKRSKDLLTMAAKTPASDHDIEDPPYEFICPLTCEIFNDPVVAADGHTYERSAIEQWLETHDPSPATGLELVSKQLIPNHSLRSLILELHETGARAPQTQTPSAERAGAGL